MHAVVMERFGGPQVLQYREVADPSPGPGQVLVTVEYAGITFVETQVRGGRGPAARQRPPLPRIPGNGVAGLVTAVGPDVAGDLVETPVVTTTGGTGGYAELAVANVADIIPLPAGLSMRDAAALLADGRTAVMLHRRAAVTPGERVLVLAAGGGLGSLLVQLAVRTGAKVIGAAGGEAKGALVTRLGAVGYVDYGMQGWEREVLAATGSGVDLIFDGVGGELGARAVTTLRPGGRVSLYGMAAGSWTDPGPQQVRVVPDAGVPSPVEIRGFAQEALSLAAAGHLHPVIGQTYPLAEAAQAHRAIEGRTTIGKTLLIP
ncbi:zinc-binding dehydrogenase [Frankia sp. QA3]|uniref:zinc-binding dehydrogenase n=1 Tax=Frankia sp. QA3 TaxID=710111 RepID=UPI000269BB75|nr:zinc-binding dehydrogenase [Frankia sp. QA3]EIV92636.1 Zn-dependent oxidoreductase, NADPH:quinone reductase [Frankia sp. QA3]